MVATSAAEMPALAVDHQSGLDEENNRADYLIIAPRNFTASAEALAAYRRTNFGKVKIAWLDDIYNQFSDGLEDPQAIRQLMQTATFDWRVSPTAVVVLGTIAAHEGDFVMIPLREKLPRYAWSWVLDECKIVASTLGSDVGNLGALAVAATEHAS